jgi:glycosyltransferase involved in cell wall biosynthesis
MSGKSTLIMSVYYSAARQVLLATERTLGRRSPQIHSVCFYLRSLIDERRYAEFDALLRRGVVKFIGSKRDDNPRCRTWAFRTLQIDARSQKLTPSGAIAPKPSLQFPDAATQVLVSIVIPCYNYGQFVGEAVNSVLAQTIASREIIIVDDGSTDLATCLALGALSRRGGVRVIQQMNQGLPIARNNGIAQARGEYICCLDADDLIAPTYLETTIAVMESDRSVGFAYSWVEFFGDVCEIWQTKDFDPETALLGNFTSVSAVFRRDDWEESGGYSATMRGGFEDWEFWIRIASLGRRGRVISHPLLRHRRHGKTMTHAAKAMQAELQARIRALNTKYFSSREFRRQLSRLSSPRQTRMEPLRKLMQAGVYCPPQRRSLLVIVPWLKQGGAEILLLGILRDISSNWHITVVTTEPDPHPMSAAFTSVTAELYHLAGTLDSTNWASFVAYLLRTRATNALLTSGSRWLLDNIGYLKTEFPRLRVANILHNPTPTRPFRALLRNDRAIDWHVTVSSRITTALRQNHVLENKIIEIANGVDVDVRFNPELVDRGAARRRLNIAKDQLALLWVGRLSVEKRPLDFIKIIDELSRHIAVRAMIIGDGPMAGELDRFIAKCRHRGNVRRISNVHQSDLPDFYAASDVLLLTSTEEGMPLVVLEALAMGCPIATTDVGDIARAVQSLENCMVVDRNHCLSLADKILSAAGAGFFTDDARRRNAERFRRSDFTQTRMTEKYRMLLNDLAP